MRGEEQRDTRRQEAHRQAGSRWVRRHRRRHVLPEVDNRQDYREGRALPHRGEGEPEGSPVEHRGQARQPQTAIRLQMGGMAESSRGNAVHTTLVMPKSTVRSGEVR